MLHQNVTCVSCTYRYLLAEPTFGVKIIIGPVITGSYHTISVQRTVRPSSVCDLFYITRNLLSNEQVEALILLEITSIFLSLWQFMSFIHLSVYDNLFVSFKSQKSITWELWSVKRSKVITDLILTQAFICLMQVVMAW